MVTHLNLANLLRNQLIKHLGLVAIYNFKHFISFAAIFIVRKSLSNSVRDPSVNKFCNTLFLTVKKQIWELKFCLLNKQSKLLAPLFAKNKILFRNQ